MSETDASRQRLSALDKSMLVLEAVAEQPQAVGLPDLTARLHMPRQTLHRVLQQLEAMEFVVREPERDRYAVGPAFTRLSLLALRSDNQAAPVRDVLRALVDDLQETCNLGVLRGNELHYIERVECDWSLRISLPVGARVPAHCTAGGKLLLAHLPQELRRGILSSGPLKRYTERTLVTRKSLDAEFKTICTKGYAENNEEFSIGTLGFAVPVKDSTKRVVAALALQAPTARVSPGKVTKMVRRLKNAAVEIEERWGLGA